MCAKQIKHTWLHLIFDVVVGRRWFWRWKPKIVTASSASMAGLLEKAEGGEISAAVVRVGCQRRRAVVLCGVGRRHGGGNPMVAVVWTSGGLG